MATIVPPTSEESEEKVTTVIAEDLHIKGSLRFETSLMMKGSLEGEISSEGLLVVGPTAKVTAKVTTKKLVSHGEITGDVTASEQVVLKGTAVHRGNITTPYIIVENGSIFNGSCVMKREAVAESPQHETGEEGSGSGTEGQGPRDLESQHQEQAEAAPVSEEYSGLPAEAQGTMGNGKIAHIYGSRAG